MRNLKQNVIFSLLILSICYDEFLAEDSPCGDWEPYKDEKCFKIFNKAGLQTYEDAEKTCHQEGNIYSSLISIRFLEEQEFISNLFKTHKVVDNVWIGLKHTSNKYKWSDDSDLVFTNWAEGSPKNKIDHCVQLQSDETSFGKWSEVFCDKKNLVICQKMQTWSFPQLQKAFLKMRDELKDTKNQLDNTRKYLENINEYIYDDCPFSGNWSKCKVITDINYNNYKLFAIPKNENERSGTWEKSMEICKKYSASLVAIESKEKQFIFQAFLGKFAPYFWTSGYRYSEKLNWMSNGSELDYGNWLGGHPSDSGNCILIGSYQPFQYYKWGNIRCDYIAKVVCEYSFMRWPPGT